MKLKEALPGMGRTVAYSPELALIFEDTKVALFLCQLIYWTGKGKNEHGWIYKTAREIYEETGLTEKEQVRIRRKLKACLILAEHRTRNPNKLYFRVDLEHLAWVWKVAVRRPFVGSGNRPKVSSRTYQTAVLETTKGQL